MKGTKLENNPQSLASAPQCPALGVLRNINIHAAGSTFYLSLALDTFPGADTTSMSQPVNKTVSGR